MSGSEQDDICTQLATKLFEVYMGRAVEPEDEDVLEQGRQLSHEAMFRAAFEGCVAKGCHRDGS